MTDPRCDELLAVISVLTEHRQIIFDLERFEPIGSLADGLRLALHREGSISRADLDRLRRWSARWQSLSIDVRTFYRVGLRETEPNDGLRLTLERAIWRLVEPSTDNRADPDGLRRMLDRIHVQFFGVMPPTDLLPSSTSLPTVTP